MKMQPRVPGYGIGLHRRTVREKDMITNHTPGWVDGAVRDAVREIRGAVSLYRVGDIARQVSGARIHR